MYEIWSDDTRFLRFPLVARLTSAVPASTARAAASALYTGKAPEWDCRKVPVDDLPVPWVTERGLGWGPVRSVAGRAIADHGADARRAAPER
jgi:hypothetical protein